MMVPMFRTASADGSPGRDGHSSISVLVESDVPSLTSLLVDEEEDRTSRTEDENGDHPEQDNPDADPAENHVPHHGPDAPLMCPAGASWFLWFECRQPW